MSKQSRWSDLGYLLGIVTLLTAAVYFFASNWSVLGRTAKISISTGLMVVLYGVSYAISFYRRRPFLAKTLLVGGLIAFGISAALLGQIYNSHADSYGLFIVWFIPAVLFSFVTRWTPFYLIAFVLGHLALAMYGESFILSGYPNENVHIITGVAAIILDALLFVMTMAGAIRSSALQRAGFWTAHLVLLYLSVSFIFEHGYGYFDALAVIALIASFLLAKSRNMLTGDTGALAALFIIVKFCELADRFYSIPFFLLGLVFLALLLFANLKLVSRLNASAERKASEEMKPETGAEQSPDEKEASSPGLMSGQILMSIMLVIGVFIGTFSIVALDWLLLGSAGHPEYVLLVGGFAGLIGMTLAVSVNGLVRYTLLYTSALLFLIGAGWIHGWIWSVLVLVSFVFVWLFTDKYEHRMAIYVLLNITATVFLSKWTDRFIFERMELVLWLVVANAAVWGAAMLFSRRNLYKDLNDAAVPSFLFWFFILTFMHACANPMMLYAIVNILFFAVATLLLYYFQHTGQRGLFRFSMGLWAAFLLYKYYDYIWKLLHKSLSLALIGLLFLVVTSVLERKKGDVTEREDTFLDRKKIALSLIVVLQLGFLGYQIASSETAIAHGKTVKLELQPRDPRSLLQGDYLVLDYQIAHPSAQGSNMAQNQRVKVAIKPDAQGIYRFERFVAPGETLRDGEVLLIGKMGYDGIRYGIEDFFIPEGTGSEFARKAKVAVVRVGNSGNAMLIRIAEK